MHRRELIVLRVLLAVMFGATAVSSAEKRVSHRELCHEASWL